MPNSISDTNPASGFVRRSQRSEENFVNCALSLDRILLSCTGGRLRGGLDFSSKPYYHGFRPLPLLNAGKLLIFRGLGYRSFRFWGNSCKKQLDRTVPRVWWRRRSFFVVCWRGSAARGIS